MFSVLVLFLLLPIYSDATTQLSYTATSLPPSLITCNDATGCEITCTGDNICKNITINAQSTAYLTITASGYSVLEYTEIICPHNAQCTIIAIGWGAMADALVYCGTNGVCDITGAERNALYFCRIYAQSSTKLTVFGDGGYLALRATVFCPRYQATPSCIMKVRSDSSPYWSSTLAGPINEGWYYIDSADDIEFQCDADTNWDALFARSLSSILYHGGIDVICRLTLGSYSASDFFGTNVLNCDPLFIDKRCVPFDSTTAPSAQPTNPPSSTPTKAPIAAPTNPPSSAPTNPPSSAPTNPPSSAPTNSPSSAPSRSPIIVPTILPTSLPYDSPAPTHSPSNNPSSKPEHILCGRDYVGTYTAADGQKEFDVTMPYDGEFIFDARGSNFAVTSIEIYDVFGGLLSIDDDNNEVITMQVIAGYYSIVIEGNAANTGIYNIDLVCYPNTETSREITAHPSFAPSTTNIVYTDNDIVIQWINALFTQQIALYATISFIICCCCCGACLCYLYYFRKKPKEIPANELVNAHEMQRMDNIVPAAADANFDREMVASWLRYTVQLPQYGPLFMCQGYDNMQAIQSIASKDDLHALGIKSRIHQSLILSEIERLQGTDFVVKGITNGTDAITMDEDEQGNETRSNTLRQVRNDNQNNIDSKTIAKIMDVTNTNIGKDKNEEQLQFTVEGAETHPV